MNWRGASSAIVICAILAGGLAACGEDDKRFSDAKIIDQLKLKKTEEGGFRVEEDNFCEVDKKLLNNADEVESAADKDELGLVLASRNADVGVLGLPPITPDCAADVKKKLNKLDPPEE